MRQLTFLLTLLFFISQNNSHAQDWRSYQEHTNFKKYQSDNEKLGPLRVDAKRVVFMGNSITEAWPVLRPEFFEDSNYIGRGISGQTTPQMLLRFRKDVINLQPEVVVILAGINDIAGNTGVTPIELIAENIMSMAELAMYHNIQVVICSVVPAVAFPWSPGLEPANKVIELNTILENFAKQKGLPYVDYHTAMKDENNGLKVPEFTSADDLVHPNKAGYILMEKLVQPAIDEAMAASSFSVNALFQNHIVLQQKEKVAIWGKAKSGNQVAVKGSWGETATATTDANGNWKLNLSTPSAGGPYQLNITSAKQSIQIDDVMIGEVWLASGQSNMQMPLKGWPPNDPIANSNNEISNAKYSNIRMFNVVRTFSLEEEETVSGDWQVCSPETVGEFSASAYFFAKRLQQELNIPIGIIHTSWGGTPAESWVSKGQIKQLGGFEKDIAFIENPARMDASNEWYGRWKKVKIPTNVTDWEQLDLGHIALSKSDYDDKNWATVNLPGRYDNLSGQNVDGVFWLRKKIELDDISSDYTFHLGAVDDSDVVFFNGKRIGGMINSHVEKRTYPIPSSILKKGVNSIVIKAIDIGWPGTVSGEMKLTNQQKTISIEGEWKLLNTAEFHQGDIYIYDLQKIKTVSRPNISQVNAFTPTVLFNAMIHPLLPYSVKGAIWYQGESNVGRAEQYQKLFPTMIKDWRRHWNSDFPFYFVQIAPYKYNQSGDASQDESQKLRDAQRHSLSLEKTGMVVTLDIGNNDNIHPANKQDVGARLAGLALANDYGKRIIASGPLYKKHQIKRKTILLEFNHVGSGLMMKGGSLDGFEIAGADKKFVSADAKISGNKIKVCAKGISKPKYVRYAWRDTSAASLFNKEGLPASSFTTEEK